jgi:hypothetical protein
MKDKDTLYFPHDYNAMGDEKCSYIITKYGMQGFGLFWAFIEKMHQQSDGKLTCKLIDGLSSTFSTDITTLKQFYNDAIDCGLFITDGIKYWSERALRNKQDLEDSRVQRSKAGKKGMEKRWGKCNGVITQDNKPITSDNNDITKHNKEDKTKEDKTKETASASIDPIVTGTPPKPAADAAAVEGEPQKPKTKTPLDILDDLACEVLDRVCISPLDIDVIKQMLEVAGGDLDLISRKVREIKKNFKPKFEGDRIKTFSYFLAGVQEEAARQKTRAAPAPTVKSREYTDAERAEFEEQSQKIMALLAAGPPPEYRQSKEGERDAGTGIDD